MGQPTDRLMGSLVRPLMCVLALAPALAPAAAQPGPDNPASLDWQTILAPTGAFRIARTETTVGQFGRFVQATGLVTLAERRGGGQVYEDGWVNKPGWTWRAPFGPGHPPATDEPAVHIAYDEAQAFCRWAGGRLPSDAQWRQAAYTEHRPAPPAPWVRGRSYRWPTGDAPAGAQCLADCGPAAAQRAVRHGARLWRGDGPALAGSTPAGVNGLHDMGGNVWEWVDEPPVASHLEAGSTPRRTRGGSWWYGQAQMQADHLQDKPGDTAVVYIGFRCVRQP